MKNSILIFNQDCSKCRGAGAILKEQNIAFTPVYYLKGELTKELLEQLPKLLKLGFKDIIRTNEEIYKELNIENKQLTDDEWVEVILTYPILLERPIFIYGNKAVIARPSELVKKIL